MHRTRCRTPARRSKRGAYRWPVDTFVQWMQVGASVSIAAWPAMRLHRNKTAAALAPSRLPTDVAEDIMKRARFIPAAGLIVLVALASHAAWPPPAGVARTDLPRRALGTPMREVVRVRVDFAPGVSTTRRSHPGQEAVQVVEGVLAYRIDGRPPITLKAGETLFIPAGALHSTENPGPAAATELATYLVERGKPALTWAMR
jgi:quercetin dioxygenase-like cupin family protein